MCKLCSPMQGNEKPSTKKKNVNSVIAFLQFLKTHAQAMHKLVHLGVCWQIFNLHKPNGMLEPPVKNLETKWDTIKHDVFEVCRCVWCHGKLHRKWNILWWHVSVNSWCKHNCIRILGRIRLRFFSWCTIRSSFFQLGIAWPI